MSQSAKIFDFLYADHEKVASILSQLGNDGTPRETSVRAQRGKDTKAAISAKIAGVGAELGSGRGLQYEVRQTYDPLWTNSRQLIGHVEELNGNEPLGLGQLRILAGDLIAFDQSVLSKLMAAGSMRDFIAAGIKDDADASKNKHKPLSEKKKEAEVIQTYIAGLGLSIQFVLCAEETGFWFNINRDYLYLHETDIPLKHPVLISGKWKVLAIIDALPHDQFSVDHLDQVGADDHMPMMISHLAQLIGITSVSFGRRLDSYGLKPLAIFREIALPAKVQGNAILATGQR
jgi:hypothetical protein